MPEIVPLPSDYTQLLAEVKERVRSAQDAALKAVNTELVGPYWDLGRIIVERQAGGTWGKSVVEKLSDDLRREFPSVGGFSASNLWRMKAFFELYREHEKLAPLVREIGWSHNLGIMERCSDPLAREFHLFLEPNRNIALRNSACGVWRLHMAPWQPVCMKVPS